MPMVFVYFHAFFVAEMVQHIAHSSQKQTNKSVLNFTESGEGEVHVNGYIIKLGIFEYIYKILVKLFAKTHKKSHKKTMCWRQ